MKKGSIRVRINHKEQINTPKRAGIPYHKFSLTFIKLFKKKLTHNPNKLIITLKVVFECIGSLINSNAAEKTHRPIQS